jgi:hypothetical protein
MALSRRGRSRRNWGIRDRIDTVNRTNVAIAIAGVILATVVILPRVYPAAKRGITCTDLASPLGGNNRSVLAQSGNDPQGLDLDLVLENEIIGAGEPLRATVTFVNKDIGPVILYLPERSPVTSRDNVFVIQLRRLDNSPLLNEPTDPLVPATFERDLHLLGSRSRCSLQIEISAAELSSLGLIPGSEYRIEAMYRNYQVGVPTPPPPGNPTATATMAYPNSQGVWTGEASSDEVRFSISQSAAAPP